MSEVKLNESGTGSTLLAPQTNTDLFNKESEQLRDLENKSHLIRWIGRILGALAGITFAALFSLGLFTLGWPLPIVLGITVVFGIPAVLLEIYIMSDFIGEVLERFAQGIKNYFNFKNNIKELEAVFKHGTTISEELKNFINENTDQIINHYLGKTFSSNNKELKIKSGGDILQFLTNKNLLDKKVVENRKLNTLKDYVSTLEDYILNLKSLDTPTVDKNHAKSESKKEKSNVKSLKDVKENLRFLSAEIAILFKDKFFKAKNEGLNIKKGDSILAFLIQQELIEKQRKWTNKQNRAASMPFVIINAMGTFSLVFATFFMFFTNALAMATAPAIAIAASCGLFMFVGSVTFNIYFIQNYFTDEKKKQLKTKAEDEAADNIKETKLEKLNRSSTNLLKVLGIFAGAAVFFYTISSIPSVGIISGTPLLITGLVIAPFILVVQLVVGYSAYASWVKKFMAVQEAKKNNTFWKRCKDFFAQLKKQISLLLKGASEGVFGFTAMMGLCLLVNTVLPFSLPLAVIIPLAIIVAVSACLNQFFQLYEFDESSTLMAKINKKNKQLKQAEQEILFSPKDHNTLKFRNRWFAKAMLNVAVASVTAGMGFVIFGLNPVALIVGAAVGFLAAFVTQAALMRAPKENDKDIENYVIPYMAWTKKVIEKLRNSFLVSIMPKTNTGKLILASIYMAGAFSIVLLGMGVGSLPAAIPALGIMGLASGATIALKIAIVLAFAAVFNFGPTLLVRAIENKIVKNQDEKQATVRKIKFAQGKEAITLEDYTENELEQHKEKNVTLDQQDKFGIFQDKVRSEILTWNATENDHKQLAETQYNMLDKAYSLDKNSPRSFVKVN